MKKKLMGVFVAAALVVSGLGGIGAHALAPQTDVTGVITNQGNAVVGALVTVTCNGNVRVDTTDAAGSYLVTYTNVECPFGTTVKVMAKKGGETGTSSGTVQGITTKLNVAIVNVSIPEYGVIGTVMAGGMGLGLMAYMRRRQQQEQL